MMYKILEVTPHETSIGKEWWEAVILGNGETKTISCFNFKPVVDKEYDLTLIKKGDYTYGNMAKGAFPKAKGSSPPASSKDYPTKEERQGNQKLIARESIVKTIFPVIYEKKADHIGKVKSMDFWFEYLMKKFFPEE